MPTSPPVTIARGLATTTVRPFDSAPTTTSPAPVIVVAEPPVSVPAVSMLETTSAKETAKASVPSAVAPDEAFAAPSCSASRMSASSAGLSGQATAVWIVDVSGSQLVVSASY